MAAWRNGTNVWRKITSPRTVTWDKKSLVRLKSWLIAINTALMAVVFAWAKEGSAFNYDRTTTFTGRNGHFQGSYVPLVFATSWQRRTNLWRGMTSPAQGPKRRRSGIGQVRPLRGLVVFNHATEVTTRRNYQNEETRLHSIGIDAHRRAPASASWVLIPADTTDRNLHGCGSSWEICHARRAARNNPTVTRANGSVPRFCYDLKTGKFTHWGECRVVTLPTGQRVKVAH